MLQACEQTRVTKKFSTTQAGAIKLARRYGQALVCVRYRESLDGSTRYTTVELLVEQAPIIKRKIETDIVEVNLAGDEAPLRSLILSSGGVWDSRQRLWRMPRGLARRLRLMNRVVEK